MTLIAKNIIVSLTNMKNKVCGLSFHSREILRGYRADEKEAKKVFFGRMSIITNENMN